MQKIICTFFCLILAGIISFFTIEIDGNADEFSQITGTTASGANINGYTTALQINVTDFGADSEGTQDSTDAIQNALNYAVDNASDLVQLKVVIPEGTYLVSHPLKIYSNTWLYMDGATLIRTSDEDCMLKNALQNPQGKYDGDRNIIIEGGCFDGNGDESTVNFSMVRLAHIRNLWIKNVEFKDDLNGHHLEIGGAKNVTVENCTFHGYYGSLEKEAIQLDTMNNATVFKDFEPFDDTSCDNIVIRNNKFYDLMRGLGSHSATIGVYYTNILISGNTFENISSIAMIMYNYKNCIIENNQINSAGYGIDFKYMSPSEGNNYNSPVNGYEGVMEQLDNNANTIIKNNNISAVITENISNPMGIQLFGRELVESEYHPDYDYKIQGVKVCFNTIKTAGRGIRMADAQDVLIQSNEIIFDNSGDSTVYNLLNFDGCTNCQAISNNCSGGNKNSIGVSGGSGNVIENNMLISPTLAGINIIDGAENILFENNCISDAGKCGIDVSDYSQILVNSNKFSNCPKDILAQTGCEVLLPAAENVKIDSVYSDRIQLSWKYVDGANGYFILRKHSNSQEDFTIVGDVTATSYVDIALASQTGYTYAIAPYKLISGEKFQGELSNEATAETKSELNHCRVEISQVLAYTGKEVTPKITLYDDDNNYILKENIDYTLELFNNVCVGTATARVYGLGRYSGCKDFDFMIKFSGEPSSASGSKSQWNAGSSVYSGVKLPKWEMLNIGV